MSDVLLMPAPGCPNCARLAAEVGRLSQEVARLNQVVEQLQAQVHELSARLDQNSSNSSRPPSTDAPWQKPAATRESSGRKPGGQPGHCGHHRELLPPERVNHIIRHIPPACAHCGAALPQEPSDNDPEPSRHQVAEMPQVVAEVTEHRGEARRCTCCGHITRAEIPADIRAHTIGPNLAATLCFLSGRCHLSKRVVQEFAADVFQVLLALGSIAQLEQEMSTALQAPYAEAEVAVRAALVKYVDESGWFQHGDLR